MDWSPFAIGCTMASTWGLVKCTLFAREHERKRVEYLLRDFRPRDELAKILAERVVLEYRLRVIPLWLIAAAASWAWLIFILRSHD
jgi:hypothetical protein